METECRHTNIVITKPCCSTPEPDTGYIACGCGGVEQVHCSDCDNNQIDEEDIEQILIRSK